MASEQLRAARAKRIAKRQRGDDHVVELARHATVPVINGLTDRFHPCQALADLLTLREKKGRLAGLKMAYVGDGNNVLHSLLHAAAATGMHLAVATPPGYEPDPEVVAVANKIALTTGARLSLFHDPAAAVRGADAVYTDVWASMGQEEEKERRIRDFQGFQVDSKLMAQAKAMRARSDTRNLATMLASLGGVCSVGVTHRG